MTTDVVEPAAALPGSPQNPLTVPVPKDQYTEEEVAEGKASAKELMKDAEVNCIAQVLYYSRQLYAMGRHMLHDRMQKRKGSECAEETIVRAMAAKADQGFDSRDLLKALTEIVLPIVKVENDDRNAALDAEEKKLKITDEDRRRGQLMPTGISYNPDDQLLPRPTTLALYGHGKAVQFVLDQIVNAALVKPETSSIKKNVVLRLIEDLVPQLANRQRDKQHVEIGLSQWLNSARSFKVLDKELSPWKRQLLGERVDMVMIDDAWLGQNDLSTNMARSRARLAADAQRVFRKWANQEGAALVVGVQLAADPANFVPQVDMEEAGWDELYAHTLLRRVDVVHALGTQFETHYRLLVDGREAFTVEKIVIDGK